MKIVDKSSSYRSIDEENIISVKESWSLFEYLLNVAKVSVPSILTSEVQIMMWIISTYFLGKLERPIYLAACGIANNWLWMAVISVVVGFGGCIDTLCAQAFGAKNNKLFCQYYNSSCVLILMIELPLLLFTWFSSLFFTYVLQYSLEISTYAQIFLRYQFIGICSAVCFELMRRYLRAQQIFGIQVVSAVTSSVSHLIFCIILTPSFGFIGIAISYSISIFASALILFLFIITNRELKKNWKINWNNLFYEGWRENIKVIWPIAWHSAALVAGEFWGLFIVCFEAAYFGEIEMSAYIILSNILDFIYNISGATSQALTSCVGASLGANLLQVAKNYIKAFFIFAYALNIILLIICILFSHEIASIFSEDPRIIEIITSIMPIVIITEVGDYFQCLLNFIIRAFGKQKEASVVTVLIFGVLQQILVFSLAFGAGLKVYGLWLTFGICIYITGAIYFIILKKLDWEYTALQIYMQLKEDKQNVASIDSLIELSNSSYLL